MPYQILIVWHRWERDVHGDSVMVVASSQVLSFRDYDAAEVAYGKLDRIDCAYYRLYEVKP